MGNELLRIPNTIEGRAVWDQLQRYTNHERFAFRRRGRGSRKYAGNQYGIPIESASSWAVYLLVKEGVEYTIADLIALIDRCRQQTDSLVSSMDEVFRLQEDKDFLAKNFDNYKEQAGETISRYANARSKYQRWGLALHRKYRADRAGWRAERKHLLFGLRLMTAISMGSVIVTILLLR